MPVSPSKDLEDGDGILDLVKGRIQVELGAELDPGGPVGCGFAGTRRNNSLGDFLCRKAEITEETSMGFGV
jgi:hypothetical protein